MRMKLTDDKVRKLPPDPAQRLEHRIADTDGGYLVIEKSGHKSFALRCRFGGKAVKFKVADFDPNYQGRDQLARARRAIAAAAAEFAAGRDPREAKRAEAAKAKSELADTVAVVFERLLAERKAEGRLRSLDQWEDKARLYVLPALGKMPMTQVKRSDIRAMCKRVKQGSGQRSSEIAYSITCTLFREHALDHDDFVNPIVRGLWEQPRRPRKRILTDGEICRIWAASLTMGSYGAGARTTLLTAGRRAEVFGMSWDEIRGDTWVLPDERNKVEEDASGGELPRPLSSAALAILKDRPHPYPFGVRGRAIRGFSKFKARLDERSGVTGWRFHDLRRTARTLMTRAKVNRLHAELCLGHRLGGVEGTYDCHDYQDEMRHAYFMLAWQLAAILDPRLPAPNPNDKKQVPPADDVIVDILNSPPAAPAGHNVIRLPVPA
jgi:integrase